MEDWLNNHLQVAERLLFDDILANGNVKAYSTVDAQVSYNFSPINPKIKIGASNLLNHYYSSFLGRPSIGGMYNVMLTYGVK